MRSRVVITGIGIQSPLGSSPVVFFERLCAGESGIQSHSNPEINYQVGRVNCDVGIHFNKLQLLNLDRVSQLAVISALDAAKHARLPKNVPLGDMAGVYFGTSSGGMESSEAAYAAFFGVNNRKTKSLTVVAAMNHAPASQIAIRLGIYGECQTYSTACSSATVAIGEAYRRIRDGYMQIALAGGADCILTPGVLHEWSKTRLLCTESDPDYPIGKSCRPFSLDRTGFSIGEGAATLVLETLESAQKRGVMPLAEIVGYGVSNDATHLTKPCAAGQAAAMRKALYDANLSPEKIGHINAHGTATRFGDVLETQSIKTAFGNHAYSIPISATKSSHGHLMGATGAVEFIATIMALREQIIPPTINYTNPDPDCDLDYTPNKARQISKLEFALSNSFAFGGNNAVLIAKAAHKIQ